MDVQAVLAFVEKLVERPRELWSESTLEKQLWRPDRI